MNVAGCSALLPLLNMKKWLKADLWAPGDKIDIDLDDVRKESFDISHNKGSIVNWFSWVFGTAPNYHEPWLEIDSPEWEYENYVIVSRTQRYRGELNYGFLSDVRNVGFIGLQEEFDSFLLQCPTAKWIPTTDFLEVGRIIMACSTFISNQTASWALSQAMGKRNCILEVCLDCPNVCSFLPENYGVINQRAFETVFRRIHKATVKKKQFMVPGF